jgi:hypothetical protein
MSISGGPGQPPPGGKGMRAGMGIFLIALGAILLFALSAGSPRWLNLHVVGLILILVGALGLLLPRLGRSRAYSGDRLNRWVRPGQFRATRRRELEQRPPLNGDHLVPARARTLRDERLDMADDLGGDEDRDPA